MKSVIFHVNSLIHYQFRNTYYHFNIYIFLLFIPNSRKVIYSFNPKTILIIFLNYLFILENSIIHSFSPRKSQIFPKPLHSCKLTPYLFTNHISRPKSFFWNFLVFILIYPDLNPFIISH